MEKGEANTRGRESGHGKKWRWEKYGKESGWQIEGGSEGEEAGGSPGHLRLLIHRYTVTNKIWIYWGWKALLNLPLGLYTYVFT